MMEQIKPKQKKMLLFLTYNAFPFSLRPLIMNVITNRNDKFRQALG